MYTRRSLVFGFLAATLLYGQETQPSIQVAGDLKQPLTLTPYDLAKMPRATVRTTPARSACSQSSKSFN